MPPSTNEARAVVGTADGLLNKNPAERSKAMSASHSTIPAGFCQIPGFPRYCVAEDGTVLSICVQGSTAVRPWSKARRLTPTISSRGYPQVMLRDMGGRRRQITVHTILLSVYVEPRPQGKECRHLDGNKTHNHISNLAWGTTRENQLDRWLHGTSDHGERSVCAKLTNDDVLQIRQRAANGVSYRAIAKDFPVAKSNIWLIVTRRTWKHI